MQNSPIPELIDVEGARATVLGQVPLMPTERVALTEALGRVLAQDVASDIDISPFDNTAMDGFAVRFEDFEAHVAKAGVSDDAGDASANTDASHSNADGTGSVNVPDSAPSNALPTPLTLDIAGIIGAGAVFEGRLQSGQALRIMTGAPMPEGADTVVKIEDTVVSGQGPDCPEGRQVAFTLMPRRGDHVRPKAEECRKGDVLLRAGEQLSPPGVGLLASTGNAEVLVYRRPRVAVFSTGNELVDVTDVPGPGQIRNSNNYALAAAVIDAGGIPTILPSVEDTREALVTALMAAVADHDFVVTSGGAAQGDYDFVTPVVRELGELFFNKVNMKPGKAQTFGMIEGTPVLGLAGNPSAAYVGFEMLIRPALRKMQGIAQLDRPRTPAVLAQEVKKGRETRRCYLRARLERVGDGTYRVTPQTNQSSALLGTLNRSNCLLIVPEGPRPLAAGEVVDCLRLDQEEGTV
jgi:molybdopterin molybdotransferase